MNTREDRIKALKAALDERILILDGAMGTMIQGYSLDENDFRGERFANHGHALKGNNDLLTLTRPDVIREIHEAFLDAGSDILETNTFNSNRISQADYGLSEIAFELNREGAKLARGAADAATRRDPSKPRFVAGAIGPTNRTASISPDVNDPGKRNVTFDELRVVYGEAVRGLIEGGVDFLLIETVFDTLNCKAAIFAAEEAFEELRVRLPVMISGTVTDLSGRTLSGQTVEAFWHSVRHAKPLAVGLNCAFGAAQLRPHIAALSRAAETYVLAYPNAGLPNAMGEYDETPETTSALLKEWAELGFVNILGGCCGTTPAHVRAIAAAVVGLPPRPVPHPPKALRLSGLEPLEVPA